MDIFNNFTLSTNKLFKYRFIGFIAIVFSFFFFNPIDSYAYIGEGSAVEFAGTNGAPIQGFNYDYNVNAYVENVKYIYMYFESNSIKGHEYEVFVDFAISYNRTYPISMGFIYAFEDEIIMPDLKSRLFTTEGQPDGGTGFYQRYNVTLNYTSVANNGHVRITIELPDVLNIWFYSVYNRTITDLTPINSDVVDSIENNTDRIIDNQNQNTDAIIDNIDDLNNTNKSIWDSIKELPSKFLDMLISLFIPDDFSFLDNFKEALESKLGFIAEIPISILDFMLNLVNATWDSFDSISFPSIEVFGFKFWDSQEISLQPAIDIFEPYKYITDVLCVILCCNTLLKWYHSFTNGGGN